MRKRMFGVAVLVVALAAVAQADTAILRDGLDGYAGTRDTVFNQGPTGGYCQSGGSVTGLYTFHSSFDSDVILVAFEGLDAINAGSVISAKLKMYKYSDAYGGSQYKIQQLGQAWAEGTENGSYSDNVDGATHRSRLGPTLVTDADWVATAGNAWKYTPPAPLGPRQKSPSDPLRRWVLESYTTYFRSADVTTYEEPGDAFASLALLEAAGPTFSNGFGYFYDTGTDELYMRADNDAGKPQAIWVVDMNNWWDSNTRRAPGYFEATAAGAGAGVWVEWDVTDLAQRWLGTDAYAGAPQLNAGVQMTCSNSGSGAGGRFYSREYVDDGTLRPTLIIEYEVPPVPEPAGLGLMGLALMSLRKRRTRRG